MKKFLKSYPEIALVTLAVVLLGTIVAYFIWGMGDVVFEVDRALQSSPPSEKMGFDLQSAAKLNLRGLVQQ